MRGDSISGWPACIHCWNAVRGEHGELVHDGSRTCRKNIPCYQVSWLNGYDAANDRAVQDTGVGGHFIISVGAMHEDAVIPKC